MSLLIILFLVIVLTLLITRNKQREINVGKLIYHREVELDKACVITEKIGFKDAIDCVKNYNELVRHFSNCSTEYELDSWTHNRFRSSTNCVELFRFGKFIKLTKTISK